MIKAFPKMGDAHYYRAHTRRHLGDAAGARADYEQALKLGTNFPGEARAGAAGPSQGSGVGSQESGKTGLASSVVARGVFAAKSPPGVSDAAWRGVLTRRGAEDFRRRMVKAYGGRCAVTGADAGAALEAALIDPDGPAEPANAVLLRADLRTLFDLNLLRVHPAARKVILAPAVMNGAYARLWARALRPPGKRDDRPALAALRKRWASAK